MGQIIDGKAIARGIRQDIASGVKQFIKETGTTPCLNVILVGDEPASQIYVRNKEAACREAGIKSAVHQLPSVTSEKEVIDLVIGLNRRADVQGILVQLPLPEQIEASHVLEAIAPEKDIDGLHTINMGKLFKGEKPAFVPCTPQGCIELILSTGLEIKGKHAVVVGRSNIVGKPMAMLLLERHATVTICHSRTPNLGQVIQQADIVVAAVGKPRLITSDMVKSGAIVIDVGMNRVDGKLCGDVDYDNVSKVAGFITPVPGGVGPMTIAMLLKNTLRAAQMAV